jgi:GT2 family glycosyltransferase
MKKIFVIIVNYKSEDVIDNAIKSFDEEKVEIEVVLLDNGSSEESYTALRKAVGDDINIICSEKNLGYSAGANYLVDYVKNNYDNVEYLFFFNPDAVATKNMVGTLYETLTDNKSAAAVSPLILDMEDNKWFSGTAIDWEKCTIDNNPNVANLDQVREIDAFNGCAVLIDAKVFFDVGMFNEDLFIYYDEPFLSMEFLKKGYISLYDPNTTAYHHISYSSSPHSTFKTYLMTRNHLYFFKMYGTSKSFLCPYLRPLRMLIFFLKRFMFNNIYHSFLGIYDEFIGKKGAP